MLETNLSTIKKTKRNDYKIGLGIYLIGLNIFFLFTGFSFMEIEWCKNVEL